MRVLVAHGDEAGRAEVAELVLGLGHDCLEATDGERAWELVAGGEVDVVVCARRLPGVDGLELCRRTRALVGTPHPHLIVLCEADDPAEALASVQAGADDHLPPRPAPLLVAARLLAATRGRRLQRELAERGAELVRVNEELERSVRTDPLTGLFNRRRLEEDEPVLDEGLRRYDRPFTVAMLDVDHFKAYNDQFGHPAGDDVLRRISAGLKATVRQGDLAYRYGGEEFLLVFPVRGLGSARVAAERARVGVERLAIPHPGTEAGTVTVSIGVAEGTAEGGLARAISEADAALYEAKAGGRNRVELAPPAVPSRIELS